MSIKDVIEVARAAAEAGDFTKAWAMMEEHRSMLDREPSFAWAWLVLADNDPQSSAAIEDLQVIVEAWWNRPQMVLFAVNQILEPIDGRPGDEPIPEGDPSELAIEILVDCLDQFDGERDDIDVEGALWNCLGNAYRLAGPPFDGAARDAYQNALAIDPESGWWWFNFGLLHKHRGSWFEGVEVFQRSRELVGDEEPVLWNLGICATAAGDFRVALDAWRSLGLEAELGADGLPSVPGLSDVKVRLSTGGIGANHTGAAPIDCEHVWVRPLSPCHGEVLNPTLYEVGVEFGDIVLWDGAPIGYARHGDRRVPRFPLLARLRSGGVMGFLFQAIQEREGQISAISDQLPGSSHLYVFDEQIRFLCRQCIADGHPEDESVSEVSDTPHRVSGKLLCSPDEDIELSAVLAALESALDAQSGIVLAIPSLYLAAGDAEGASHQQERLTRFDSDVPIS